MEFNGPPEHIPTFDVNFERELAASLVNKIPTGNAKEELERDSLFRKILNSFGKIDASSEKKSQILEDLESSSMSVVEFNSKYFKPESDFELLETEGSETATN
ncbi:MAG: hypothetical protein RL641_622 [Candidatus Parcubacteria bacterium]|jgi:hypothetical protein